MFFWESEENTRRTSFWTNSAKILKPYSASLHIWQPEVRTILRIFPQSTFTFTTPRHTRLLWTAQHSSFRSQGLFSQLWLIRRSWIMISIHRISGIWRSQSMRTSARSWQTSQLKICSIVYFLHGLISFTAVSTTYKSSESPLFNSELNRHSKPTQSFTVI